MNSQPTKWEYTSLLLPSSGWLVNGKVDVQKLTDHLNRLGEEGWELVNTFDTNFRDGGTRDVIAILKRPMSASHPPRL